MHTAPRSVFVGCLSLFALLLAACSSSRDSCSSGACSADMAAHLPDLGMSADGGGDGDMMDEPGTPREHGVCSAGWCWRNPLPQGNTLAGIWGTSQSSIWAVGQRETILKYDGTQWVAQHSGDIAFLDAIWGASGSDIWAGGYMGRLLHFDGTTWSVKSSGTSARITAIWGADASHVWAVGTAGTIA